MSLRKYIKEREDADTQSLLQLPVSKAWYTWCFSLHSSGLSGVSTRKYVKERSDPDTQSLQQLPVSKAYNGTGTHSGALLFIHLDQVGCHQGDI